MSASRPTLNGGLFQNNQSRTGSGGGLDVNNTFALTGTQFINNMAMQGGGIYHSSIFNGRLVNALFARNVATSTLGAAVYLDSSGSVQILHTTIASPNPGSGSAIYIVTGTVGITNTIIVNHSVGISNTAGKVYQGYNLFYGNGSDTRGTISNGAHISNTNPSFVNPAANNYHLNFGSPAIDTGANVGVLNDLDGIVRPQFIGFDRGAYEYFLKRLFLPIILK